MKMVGLLGASVLGVILLAGCAGTQPLPQTVKSGKLKSPRAGKGMLYVYRPSSFVGGAVYYDVRDSAQGDKVIGTITSGSVIEQELNPGSREIWAKTEAKVGVPVTIKSGRTSCVKAGVGMGLFIGRPTLQKVDLETCRYDIMNIAKEKRERAAQEEREKNRKDGMGLPK